MDHYFKNLIFVSLICTLQLSAMDPSSLPLSAARPQEVSSYAGQDSERKQEQASLEAPQQNLRRAQMIADAFNALPKKTKETDAQTVRSRLSQPLQNLIGKFSPLGNKYYSYYPKHLIPAVIECSDLPIYTINKKAFIQEIKGKKPTYTTMYDLLEANEKQLSAFLARKQPIKPSAVPYIVGQTRFLATEDPFAVIYGRQIQHFQDVKEPQEESRLCKYLRDEEWEDESTYSDYGFTSHIYNDGIILFKMHHHDDRKLLQKLSIEQTRYVHQLYCAHAQAKRHGSNRTISLSPEQVQIHLSLPERAQRNLEKNYQLKEINEIRERERKQKCKILSRVAGLCLAVGSAAALYLNSVL